MIDVKNNSITTSGDHLLQPAPPPGPLGCHHRMCSTRITSSGDRRNALLEDDGMTTTMTR
jgi:hypothetical protein